MTGPLDPKSLENIPKQREFSSDSVFNFLQISSWERSQAPKLRNLSKKLVNLHRSMGLSCGLPGVTQEPRSTRQRGDPAMNIWAYGRDLHQNIFDIAGVTLLGTAVTVALADLTQSNTRSRCIDVSVVPLGGDMKLP